MFKNRSSADAYASIGLLLWLWLTVAGTAHGQSDSLGGLTRKFNRYQQAALPEKLFLHLDRPLYITGETMWFKVYAVDGTQVQPLPLSTVAYVEVLDKANQPVLQAKVALKNATGQGSFLLPTSLASGSYTVRAYTAWMKNFGPEYYFHTSVTVLNTFTASGTAAKDSAATADYDVQFFPEGGNLVQGLASKIAFKITDKAGRGRAAQGKILDQSGKVVATFSTLRFGMGSFLLTPEAGNTYTALITASQNQLIRRALPQVYEQGYVMRLEDNGKQALTVSVSTTKAQAETVFLLGHARQQVVVAARAQLVDGHADFTISKDQLLNGISHFTLFNAGQQPLCERLYFQPSRHQLTITARPDKDSYTTRDQVSLQVATAGTGTQLLGANLSMAVYRLDSLTTAPTADINSYLWLAADLKGTVENPDYYFAATGPEVAQATDNLMLTQGWSRFRWEQVLAAKPVTFEDLPELHGPLVRGRITQKDTNAPLPGVVAYLAAPSRIIRLSNATSNAAGLIQFEMSEFYGPQDIIVQTDPQQDSTCHIEILSPFSSRYASAAAGGFATVPRFQADYTRRHFQTQVQNAYFGKYKNRFIIPAADSVPFYGKADETYFLDKYTRFKVLEEVMREYVPGVLVKNRKDGFHFSVDDKINQQFLSADPMILLDGMPVFNTNKLMAMDPLKIQKLEVIDSRYFHGAAMYSGVVSYTTYKGNLEGFPLNPQALVQQYEGVQWQREFYAPRYDTPQRKQSRLPDLRNLLYWNPEITSTSTEANKLVFYTGDQAGRYLVVIQGLATNGLAGSTHFVFEVKPML